MEAEIQKKERRLPGRKLRRLHRIVGLICTPMMLITSICGAILLLRKSGLYERKGDYRNAIQSLHCYELILPYVGIIACGLMSFVAITGVLLALRQRRSRSTT
ncbi:MAG: hypothetical protein RBU45_16015 [Myxococcota bacterium]|jgi:uncharacterized iron-regulated membrane protein|nr:hypothetical protein [Myxococcota bacterium]